MSFERLNSLISFSENQEDQRQNGRQALIPGFISPYLMTQQAIHLTACRDEVSPKELGVLKRLRSTLERHDDCSSQLDCECTALHSNFALAFASQPIPQTIALQECCSEKSQIPIDIEDQLPCRKVRIGPDFQVLIPSWKPRCGMEVASSHIHYKACMEQTDMGDVYDDSEWLGAQVWPPPESTNIVSDSQIGRGRSDSCDCEYPGSTDCVRLHIQEENSKLELSLGMAFQLWGFHDMGELVSKCWSEEEQEQFKFLVKLNPPCEKNFWHYLPSTFTKKSPRDFASYYFNVFVLQQRAIQNRLGPENVDSDDDQCSLTSSDYEESEEYVTDIDDDEEEVEEDGEEEGLQNAIDIEHQRSLEVSDFSEPAMKSERCILSKQNADCLRDDASNAGSMEELVCSSISKEDPLLELQIVGHLICSPQSISSWHHNSSASFSSPQETTDAVGESGFQGGENGILISKSS